MLLLALALYRKVKKKNKMFPKMILKHEKQMDHDLFNLKVNPTIISLISHFELAAH